MKLARLRLLDPYIGVRRIRKQALSSCLSDVLNAETVISELNWFSDDCCMVFVVARILNLERNQLDRALQILKVPLKI